jgi:hypothetical protein
MKTERMVLLITPDEKARINAEALKLGVSASEFVRKAAALLDADDFGAVEELKGLLPEVEASLDRMEANFVRLAESSVTHRATMDYQRSDDYRNEVREQLLADPSIDWDRARAVFGGRGAAAA